MYEGWRESVGLDGTAGRDWARVYWGRGGSEGVTIRVKAWIPWPLFLEIGGLRENSAVLWASKEVLEWETPGCQGPFVPNWESGSYYLSNQPSFDFSVRVTVQRCLPQGIQPAAGVQALSQFLCRSRTSQRSETGNFECLGRKSNAFQKSKSPGQQHGLLEWPLG